MSTPSISDLRKRQNISKKKRNLKEPEPMETFEEYKKRIEKEREEQKERGKIRDPLEDEKLVQEWMKEEEDKKKKLEEKKRREKGDSMETDAVELRAEDVPVPNRDEETWIFAVEDGGDDDEYDCEEDVDETA